jgi:glycine/D-amino acid oxidase-like deaminating enzyme
MNAPLPSSGKKRVVIIGGGFAGLQLARKLAYQDLQVVLLDKNNYSNRALFHFPSGNSFKNIKMYLSASRRHAQLICLVNLSVPISVKFLMIS